MKLKLPLECVRKLKERRRERERERERKVDPV